MSNEGRIIKLLKRGNFDSIEHTNNIIHILKNLSTKEKNLGKGRTSIGYITKLDGVNNESKNYNNKKYIIKETIITNKSEIKQTEKELDIYEKLMKDPEYTTYISNLLYADVPLVLHKTNKYNYSYFVFEYNDGDTLENMIANKEQIPKDEVKKIIEHLKNAVLFLERNGIVHRDIKPGNIYYDKIHKRPLLFDFNSACYANTDDCKISSFIGTAKYGKQIIQFLKDNPWKRYEYTMDDDMKAINIIEEDDLPIITKQDSILNETYISDSDSKVNKRHSKRSRTNANLNENNFTYKRRKLSSIHNIIENKNQDGGTCPCKPVDRFRPIGGKYKKTRRNIKYLKKWKRGEKLGFTLTSSLKAKGLIPRANGTYRVSNKYRG